MGGNIITPTADGISFERTVTLSAGLWDRLLYAASLGAPMYGDSTEAEQTRKAWTLVSEQLGTLEPA